MSTAWLRVPPWSNCSGTMPVTSKPCCRATSSDPSLDAVSTTHTRTTWRLWSRACAIAAAASTQRDPPLRVGTITCTDSAAPPDSGLCIEKTLPDRQQNNAQVQPQRPVIDIPEVVLNALFHLFQRVGLAPETIHLRPAR